MKRFYKTASLERDGSGPWRILLDGRPVRTPGKVFLEIASEPLGREIVAEWTAQGERIDPRTMPLTSLASTAADRVRPLRPGVTDQLLHYVRSDMLCYRAEDPAELVARQAAAWQPMLDWLGDRFGVRLAVTCGVMPARQPPEATATIRGTLDALDDDALTAVSSAAAASGSLVLALALIDGRIDAPTATALSQLDELWQIEKWGEDAEARQRLAALGAEIAAAARYHALSRP